MNVLSTHPDTKHHFEALMGSKQTPTNTANSKEISKQKSCKTRHCDISKDYDEMNDMMQDNSATKGGWAKNKTIICEEGIHTKVPVNMDRKVCQTKVNNSMEKRTSTMENVYNEPRDGDKYSQRVIRFDVRRKVSIQTEIN